MGQNLLIDSDLSVSKNLDGEYEFLKDLRLIEDDIEIKIGNNDANDEFGIGDDTDDNNDDDDEFWTSDDDIEEDDGWWDPSKQYTRHNYIAHFGRKA